MNIVNKIKNNRITISIIVGLIIVSLIASYFMFFGKEAEAAWWDESWMYRQRVDITNSGSAQTDFQVTITLNTSSLITAGKMQNDCDDIRVTDINGKMLSYWVQSHPSTNTCNQSATKIWVKTLSIPTNDATIYLYYGNPSATQGSNGNTTFIYFDDFQADTSSDYTVAGDQETWTISGGIATDDTSNTYTRWVTNTSFSETNFKVQTYLRDTDNDWAGIVYQSDTGSNFYTCNYRVETDYVYIGENTHSGLGSGVFDSTANTWYTLTARVIGSNHYCDVDGTQYASATDSTLTSGRIGMYSGANSPVVNYEYIFMAKTASTEPSPGSPTNEEIGPGPVAYWKFDEGYGTSANDQTPNSNTGTITSATWQSEAMCVSGKCLHFDGSNDLITISSIPDNLKFTYGSTFAISAWIKANTATGTTRYTIVGEQRSTSLFFGLYGNQVSLALDDGHMYSTQTINTNEWTHVAVSYNGSTHQATFFINGAQDNTAVNTDEASSSYSTLYIGYEARFFERFHGFIDEVKIYPYARSAAEIKADYAARGTSKGVAAALGSSSDKWLSDGLVGYWKMDESSWGTAIDSSGNGNNGTVYGEMVPSTGKFGNGGVFDGAGDYMNAGNTTSLDVDTFTVSSWIKTTGTGYKMWMARGGGQYWLSHHTSRLHFCLTTSEGRTDLYATVNYYDNKWHHVVNTYDGAYMKMYMDGVEINSFAKTGTISGLSDLLIGRYSIDYQFTGSIDEMRIYNRALSPKEVRDLYNWAPGPVGYWNFDEKTGTTLYDKSGNGNNSSQWNGTPTWANGKFGGALNFDGSGTSGVEISSPSNFDFPAFTAEIWIDGTNQDAITRIVNYGTNGSNYGGFIIGQNTNGTLRTYIDTTGAGGWDGLDSTGTVNDGKWHHLALVYDGTNRFIYIDSVKDASTDVPAGYDSSPTTPIFTIGQGSYDNEEHEGKIDDVRIYNYARTPKQIVQDMNAGHPAVGSPVGSAVGYWKFDEGYGTTINDSGFGGNNGTITGASWTNQGKFGKALDFVNETDRVDYSTDFSEITEEITVSAWAYPELAPIDQGRIVATTYDWDAEPSNARGWNLGLTYGSGDTFGFQIWDSLGSSASANKSGFFADNLNTWTHVTGTFKSSEYVRLYINGVLAAEDTTSVPSAIAYNGTYNLRIGSRSDNFSQGEWDGLIDEVKIYPFALTEDEIRVDYNRGAAILMGATGTDSDGSTASWSSERSYCPPGDTTASCAPVAEWKFDEKTGTTANDTSGTGNTGTLAGSPVWKSAGECKVGACLTLDHVDDRMTVSHSTSLEPASITVEAWIKLNDISDRHILITKWLGYSFEISAARYPYFRLNEITPTDLYSSQAITWGKWHHIAATLDNTTKQRRIYLDGVNTGSETVTGSIGYNQSILAIPYSSATWTNGRIDHVKIYDYARTPAQVAWDYNRGKPVGWWKFDEGEGMTAHDASGNANNGTLEASMTSDDWVDGKYNTALDFDGGVSSGDYVTLGSSHEIDLTSATVSLWAKRDVLTTTQDATNTAGSLRILYGGGSYKFLDQWVNDTYFQFRGERNVNSEYWALITSSVEADTSWHHFVITADDNVFKLYIDGEYQGTDDDSSSGYTSNTCTISAIARGYGVEHSSYGSYFEGQIDESKFYNYPLNPLQIKTLFNEGSAVRFGL